MSIGYIVAIVMSPLRAGLGPWSWSCKIVLVVKSLLVYHSIVWRFQLFLAPTNVTTVAVLFGLKISSLCQSWYHYCPAGHVMFNNDLSICRRPRGLCMVWVSVLFHWWSSCLHHWRYLVKCRTRPTARSTSSIFRSTLRLATSSSFRGLSAAKLIGREATSTTGARVAQSYSLGGLSAVSNSTSRTAKVSRTPCTTSPKIRSAPTPRKCCSVIAKFHNTDTDTGPTGTRTRTFLRRNSVGSVRVRSGPFGSVSGPCPCPCSGI